MYRASNGTELLIIQFDRPTKYRVFHNKKYKAVKVLTKTKECIIVAKSTKKAPEITDEELEELEALEELDADDEDVEDDEEEVKPKSRRKKAPVVEEDDEDEDEDEDDDEEPAPKKGKGKKSTPSRSRTTDGKVGTAELAEYCGVESRVLRMVLRKHKIEKDPETGRYEWASLKDPEVKKIKKLIDAGEAKNITKEALDKLKDSQAAKKEQKAAGKKGKGKKGKKSAPVVEDLDDDDDLEDEDDD